MLLSHVFNEQYYSWSTIRHDRVWLVLRCGSFQKLDCAICHIVSLQKGKEARFLTYANNRREIILKSTKN